MFPVPYNYPAGITSGPQSAMWFAGFGDFSGVIGKIEQGDDNRKYMKAIKAYHLLHVLIPAFYSMDWLISQRLPSGSAKCAVRNPQLWLVGGLTNVTPFAVSSWYAASTSVTPAAKSPRGPPAISSSLTCFPNRSAVPSGESKIKYNPSSSRKLAELASLP